MFLELLENEMKKLDDLLIASIYDLYEGSETIDEFRSFLCEDLKLDSDHELIESIVKTVDSNGLITRKMSRKIRSRRATVTTGMSKHELRMRSRKSARTKKRSAGTVRKAIRKQRKAMRKRKQLGVS